MMIQSGSRLAKPVRIRQMRDPEYKLPPNTLSVTKGIYANPFRCGGWYMIGDPDKRSGPFRLTYTRTSKEHAMEHGGFTLISTKAQAVQWYREYLRKYPLSEKQKQFLRGKNLACFCKPEEACHADVLLEIANASEPKG